MLFKSSAPILMKYKTVLLAVYMGVHVCAFILCLHIKRAEVDFRYLVQLLSLNLDPSTLARLAGQQALGTLPVCVP